MKIEENEQYNPIARTDPFSMELEEYKDSFEQLIHSLPVAMYTTDAHGYINLYNEAAIQLWGREPESGKDLWCGSWKIFRTNGSPLPLESCPMAITIREGRPVFGQQIIIERPDGTRSHVAPHPRPIFNRSGQLTGAVNMLVDMTDIKKSEIALAEKEKMLRILNATLEKKVDERTGEIQGKQADLKKSEDRYHRMIEEVEDYAILLLDKDGIISNWNKGAEKIKGYKEKEIVGQHFRVFYLPEDQQSGLPESLIGKAITEGKAMHEGWRLRKDGTAFWGSIVITALHDPENNIIGFSKVTRDLTERKATEDQIKRYAAELEFQNRELQQFNSIAAHDMKEPIRKIEFYNTAILDNAGSLLPEKERNYLSRSITAAQRMKGLIEDLLTYSKTSLAGEKFEPVDLNETLKEVTFFLQDAIEKYNVVITTAPLPIIPGISFQIRQLFDNIVSNSLKYRHPDRNLLIDISCKKIPSPPFSIPLKENVLGYYKISFRDNGIGFNQEYAEKIFDMFQRLHRRDIYPGTGIGLAICKKAVLNHNGFIQATGNVKEGACFDIYFPINQ